MPVVSLVLYLGRKAKEAYCGIVTGFQLLRAHLPNEAGQVYVEMPILTAVEADAEDISIVLQGLQRQTDALTTRRAQTHNVFGVPYSELMGPEELN